MNSKNIVRFASTLESRLDEVLFRANPYVKPEYNQEVDENGFPIGKAVGIAGGSAALGGLGYGAYKLKGNLDERIAKATVGMPKSMRPGTASLYTGAAQDLAGDVGGYFKGAGKEIAAPWKLKGKKNAGILKNIGKSAGKVVKAATMGRYGWSALQPGMIELESNLGRGLFSK